MGVFGGEARALRSRTGSCLSRRRYGDADRYFQVRNEMRRVLNDGPCTVPSIHGRSIIYATAFFWTNRQALMIEYAVKSTSASVVGQEITDRRIIHCPRCHEPPSKQTPSRSTCAIISRG